MPPEALQFRASLLAEVQKGPLINLQTAEVRNHRRLATSPYARALQKCAPGLLYRRASGILFFVRGAQATAPLILASYQCAPLLLKLTQPPRRPDKLPHVA